MQYRRIITKLWTIPYNAILLALIFVTPYTHRGNLLHDAYVVSLWQMPLSMKFGMMAWCAVFAAYVAWIIVKWLYYKPRPIPQPYKTRWQKIDASSFPSMHTAVTLILAYYGARTAYIFTSWRIEVVFFMLRWIIFVSVAFSRVVLKRHYRSDILVGMMFGLMIIYNVHYVRQLLWSFW